MSPRLDSPERTQSIGAVARHGAAKELLSKTGLGPTTALAADKTYLYAGSASGVDAFWRSSGALAQHWQLSPSPRALSQLVVAGNRVWGLLTPTGFARKPSSLVELDPTSPTRVRTVNGVLDTLSIAASHTGIYYVSDKDSTLVRLTNDGVRTTAKTHLVVSQFLAGPAAVQAVLVVGNSVFVRFDAGQGTDAGIYVYNASSLAGPGKRAMFNASSALGWTSLGVLEVANGPEGDECPAQVPQQCLQHYGIGVGVPDPR